MPIQPKSLQSRLLLGILASLTATLALGGVVIYKVIDGHLRQEFDSALAEKSRFYSTTLKLSDGKASMRMGQAEWDRVSDPANPDYVQFWFLPQGKFLFRSPGMRGKDLPRIQVAGVDPVFTDAILPDGAPGRLISRVFYPTQETGGADRIPVQLAVAHDTRTLREALDEVRWFLIKSAILTILVLMLATRWIVQRGVRPVAGLAGQIETMPLVDSEHRFGLPGAPAELQPVVARLNALMDRVATAIEHERMFTSNAAHELRNPLAAIRSRVELALSRTRSVEEYEETLEGILESQNGMQRVVDHLLLLARLESGHHVHEFSQETVSLPKLLRKAWSPCFDLASSRRLKVSWQIHDLEEDVVLPVALTGIVLRNLFDNAVAYTPEGGEILISAERTPGGLAIAVANTNPGLDPAKLEETFAPFWRGDPNASGHRGNAGIGLALVRRIMDTVLGQASASISDDKVVYRVLFPLGSVSPVLPVPPLAGTPQKDGEVSVVSPGELSYKGADR